VPFVLEAQGMRGPSIWPYPPESPPPDQLGIRKAHFQRLLSSGLSGKGLIRTSLTASGTRSSLGWPALIPRAHVVAVTLYTIRACADMLHAH